MTHPTPPDGTATGAAGSGARRRPRPCSSPTTTRCGSSALERDLAGNGLDVVATAADGPRDRAPGPGHPARRARARPQPARPARRRGLPRAVGDLPTRVLILSASGEQHDVLAAIKAGATGLPRQVGVGRRDRGRRARHGARRGRCSRPGWRGSCSGSSAGWPRARPGRRPADGRRTTDPRAHRPRDRGAAARRHRHVLQGDRGELFLSHRTVQNHVQNTLGKLQLHNRVELVRFALARGLEDEDRAAPNAP